MSDEILDFNTLKSHITNVKEDLGKAKDDLSKAKNTVVEDTDKNFNSNNLEEILKELFNLTTTGKTKIITSLNNKFDLNIPIDSTFEKVSNIINNIILDSMKKTIKIEKTMDFPDYSFETNIGLLDNTIHLNGELNIETTINFSNFNMEVK